MLIYYDEKNLLKHYFLLPIHKVFVNVVPWFCYTIMMTLFLNLLLILGLDILVSFDPLGSTIGNFIQDMKPAVWSNSVK